MVHEIGATEEEMTESREIYEHHRVTQAALVTATVVTAVADVTVVAAAVVDVDAVDGAATYGPVYVAVSLDVVARGQHDPKR